jgi:membrane protein YqaA with SNARE-associated domain
MRSLLIFVVLVSAPIAPRSPSTGVAGFNFDKVAATTKKSVAPVPHKRRPAKPLLEHLGGLGLFIVAVLDGSPVPTFGGLDILTAVLAARHAEPWFYYAAIATASAVIGAYLTFKAARKAGAGYLERRFGKPQVSELLGRFQKWGTGALALSAAVPFPFPTSFFFTAAGVLKYSVGKFLAVVAVCRGIRYATIALIASLYGRHFVHALRNPGQYYGWLLGIAIALASVIIMALLLRKRFQATA